MTDQELEKRLREIAKQDTLPEKAPEIITAAADRISMMRHIIETQVGRTRSAVWRLL